MSDTFHLYDISRQLDLKKNKGNGDADVTDIPGTGYFFFITVQAANVTERFGFAILIATP
jgi:hypothetical protein